MRQYECINIIGCFGCCHDVQRYLPETEKYCPGVLPLLEWLIFCCCNILEMNGTSFFHISIEGMMDFDHFALLFISIILFSTLIYFILSAKDMEKVGVNYAEYFALIFFILCGMVLVSSFKSLLIFPGYRNHFYSLIYSYRKRQAKSEKQ